MIPAAMRSPTRRPAGRFARLIAEAGLGGLPPVTLLALLKHPLFRLGEREGGHAGAVAALERAILRGPRPRPGTAGITDALTRFRAERPTLHRRDPRILIREDDLAGATALAAGLAAAFAPLEKLGPKPHLFTEIATAHRAALAALSRPPPPCSLQGRPTPCAAGCTGAGEAGRAPTPRRQKMSP
jgi:ATP-dependent helicase/nuclease subunit B